MESGTGDGAGPGRSGRPGPGRVVAVVVCVVAGVPFALGLVSVLSSVLGDGDPHGYALIAGTLLCVVSGVLLLLAFPAAVPSRWRRPATRVSTAVLLAFAGVVLIAGLTAVI